MVTEDYVGFETAKLLKEKGFDEYCYGYYYTSKYMTHGDIKQRNSELFPDSYSAPTLQMAMKWLREVYNLVIQIVVVPHTTVTMEQKYYVFVVCKDRRNLVFRSDHPHDRYSTYEEASEAGIKYCLENLI